MESVTIMDIARLCGVGVSTVSRAINNHPDISEDTKAMILKVIKEHNYIPNNSARNLKRSDSKTIAILIKGISNPFFNAMIKVFEQEIELMKYSFLLHRVDDHENEIDVALELEKEKRLKGIVFLGGYFSHSEEELKGLKVPFVLSTVGLTKLVNKSSYLSVAVDDRKESYKLVDYLCKLGHKRIAIICSNPEDVSIGRLRLDGYKLALKDNDIPLDNDLVRYNRDIESYSMKYGYETTKELLQSDIDVTAIYAISDSMAVGACKAIFDVGKKIPEDYSVAGFDGMDIAFYYNPSITTIRQPVKEMAYETIHILFDIIDKKKNRESKVFPAELVIGQSTSTLK